MPLRPSQDREGLKQLHDFLSLAKARRMTDGSLGHSHCVPTVDSITNTWRCLETMRFVAIHFDSFCGDLCSSSDCPPDTVPGDCAACAGTSPFDTCWCACPHIQVSCGHRGLLLAPGRRPPPPPSTPSHCVGHSTLPPSRWFLHVILFHTATHTHTSMSSVLSQSGMCLRLNQVGCGEESCTHVRLPSALPQYASFCICCCFCLHSFHIQVSNQIRSRSPWPLATLYQRSPGLAEPGPDVTIGPKGARKKGLCPG